MTKYAFIFALLLNLTGCIVAPLVDAFNKIGLTESDRVALLTPDVKGFNEALIWGDKSRALAYASEKSREKISEQLDELGEEMKVVDSKIKDIEFKEDSYKASVSTVMRYYKVPYYVVKNRKEIQEWVFDLQSGWKMSERTVKDIS